MSENIQNALRNMLGRNALSNSYQVDADFAKLTHTVQYLITQLKVTKRFCSIEGEEHVEDVIKNAADILIGK